MTLRYLPFICLLLCHCTPRQSLPKGVTWDAKSATFHWWRGEVRLPRGYAYQLDGGDTFVGHFTSPDAKIVIHHDIGGYAGAWARFKKQPFEESIIDNARVWIGHRPWNRTNPGETTLCAVTFPKDCELIQQLARTFRPIATKRSNLSMCDGSR